MDSWLVVAAADTDTDTIPKLLVLADVAKLLADVAKLLADDAKLLADIAKLRANVTLVLPDGEPGYHISSFVRAAAFIRAGCPCRV